MKIDEILQPGQIALDLRAPDKKRLLEEIARRLAATVGLEPRLIFEALTSREMLGSTGVGDGIAIPHARLAHVVQPVGLFTRLKPALDFDAVDTRKVDLVFVLLLPEKVINEHLHALACVARRLRDEDSAARLRHAIDAEGTYNILIGR